METEILNKIKDNILRENSQLVAKTNGTEFTKYIGTEGIKVYKSKRYIYKFSPEYLSHLAIKKRRINICKTILSSFGNFGFIAINQPVYGISGYSLNLTPEVKKLNV